MYPREAKLVDFQDTLRAMWVRHARLNISQVFKLVKCSPLASCLGSSLPGRNPSRLAPTNVGTPCAFLTGREKCGLVYRLLNPFGFAAGRLAAFQGAGNSQAKEGNLDGAIADYKGPSGSIQDMLTPTETVVMPSERKATGAEQGPFRLESGAG